MGKVTLYSYFRSSCSWRVRIALALKDIDYDYEGVHLVKDGGQQLTDEYKKINPIAQVPSLRLEDGTVITQSVAILEYLEEAFDNVKLFPEDIKKRAKVREIVELINSGTQPIQNLSVMLKHSSDAAVRTEWSRYWIEKGLRAVEAILAKSAGRYCVGDELSLADCCLVPQVYNANRFKVDMSQFPVIRRVLEALEALDAFKAAHPSNQPDCPADLK